jgi:hypothetical protein
VPVRHTKSPRTPAHTPRSNFRTPTPGLEFRGRDRSLSAPYNAELARKFRLAYPEAGPETRVVTSTKSFIETTKGTMNRREFRDDKFRACERSKQ